MQLIFHLGAHCTDDEALVKCLLTNRDRLAPAGISIPDPGIYRWLLRDALVALEGQPATPEGAAALLDGILPDEHARRAVMGWDAFLGFPRFALRRNQFYPAGPDRARALAGLFPGHQVEFALALRNPATFLPALFERQKTRSHAEFLEGCDPAALAWSDLVDRIRAACPQSPLTVWADEDTPLIWPELLRVLTRHPAGLDLEDTDIILRTIMSPEGLARMHDYLAHHPPQTELQRRRIVSAFLDKFALPDRIEVELDMPGWTDELVERLTLAYEADMERIADTPGVTFIAS